MSRARSAGWWRAACGALLLTSCAVGCTVRTGAGPQPPPAAGEPASGAPGTAAGPSDSSRSEQTAIHASVAAQVAVVRGLLQAVGDATADRSLGLGPRAARAYRQASPVVQEARQQLIAGRHRVARSRAVQALQLAAPAIDELSAKSPLPAKLRRSFAERAAVGRDAVDRAVQAVRSTGQSDGLGHFERAASMLAELARAAGGGRPPARAMGQAAAELDRGLAARFPSL